MGAEVVILLLHVYVSPPHFFNIFSAFFSTFFKKNSTFFSTFLQHFFNIFSTFSQHFFNIFFNIFCCCVPLLTSDNSIDTYSTLHINRCFRCPRAKRTGRESTHKTLWWIRDVPIISLPERKGTTFNFW